MDGEQDEIDVSVCENITDCIDAEQLLNVLHFNIRSLRKNFEQLLVYLYTLKLENVDVIILSETWKLENVSDFHITGFALHHNMSQFNQNDGLAIYVREELLAECVILHLTETNLLRITFAVDKMTIGITGSYRSPPVDIKQYITDLDGFFLGLNKQKVEIFVGDININILNDNTDTDSIIYQSILARSGFFSYINKPTRITENTRSLIDHIFVRLGDKQYLGKQLTLKPFLFMIDITDHFPIGILIKQVNKNRIKNYHVDKYREIVNHKKLLNKLKKENWQEVLQTDEVQLGYDMFINRLNAYVTMCTRQIKCTNVKDQKIKPWITIGIINSIKRRDKLKRIFLKAKTQNNKVLYTQYRNLLNKIIKKLKNDYYKTKLKESRNNFKRVWETINEATNTEKKAGNNMRVNLEDECGKLLIDENDKVEAFNKFFTDIGKKMQMNVEKNYDLKDLSTNDTFVENTLFLNPVTQTELIKHISTLKNNSASGPDGVSVRLVKTCHEYLLLPMCHVFNLCFEKGKIPQTWKDSVVTPIFKSGNRKLLTNYRPISVISNIAKLFEKCLKQRLVSFLDKHKILSNKQYGFREKLSTTDAVIELLRHLTFGLNNNKKCLAVFLDLAKAFDTVDHRLLLDRLEKIGIRGSAFDIFSDYLRNRRQKVKLTNVESGYQIINTGIPQGTVLGPVLFLIYINTLYGVLGGDSELISYADDTVLIFSGNTWGETYEGAESGLRRIYAWLNRSLLSLNIGKTHFVAFSLTVDGQPEQKYIKVHGAVCGMSCGCECPRIDKVDNVKYLGLFVDCHLRWTLHVEYLTKRLKQLTYKFYQLRDILSLRNLRTVYSALAESIITYCILAWGGLYDNALNCLAVMQNTVLKILFKRDIRHSTRLLYKELKILSVRERYIYESLLWVFSHKEVRNINADSSCITRSVSERDLNIPFFRRSHVQRSVFYYGPKIFNSLPVHIKNVQSKSEFKRKIKHYINESNDILKLLL